MDCKICNPDTEDENVCESCTDDLYPAQVVFRELSGQSAFTEHLALIYLDAFAGRPDRFLEGYIAGAQLPFKVVVVRDGIFENCRVERCEIVGYGRPISRRESGF